MAHESLSLSELIPASGDEIYTAWLNSDVYSAFTGDKAEIEPVVGGKHSSFDGYAQGRIVDLEPGRRIVQTWRTSDFPEGSPDSRLELTLEVTVGGTMLTLLHTEIPDGQSDNYRDGWVKFYFAPLKKYFGEKTAVDPPQDTDNDTGNNQQNGVSEAAIPSTDLTARAKVAAPKPAKAAKPAKPAAVKAKAETVTPPTATAPVKAAAKSKANVKPAAKAASKPAPAAKPPAKAKAAAKAPAKAKAKPAAKAKAKATVKAKTKAKVKAKAKPAAKAKAKAKSKAKKPASRPAKKKARSY